MKIALTKRYVKSYHECVDLLVCYIITFILLSIFYEMLFPLGTKINWSFKMKLQLAGALLLSSVAFNSAYAAHFDIGFEVHHGTIELTVGEHDHDHGHAHSVAKATNSHDHSHEQPAMKNGKYVFEADFGDFAGGPNSTDDPGFAAAKNALPANTVFTFQGLGKLSFWDGKTWSNSTTDSVTIVDSQGNESQWNNAGYNAGATNYIGQSDVQGGFHEHIDYNINESAAVGVYAIEFKIADLHSTLTASDSFYVVFNRGLSHTAFEASVDAFVNEVPVPAAAWLMLSGLVGLGMAKRKQA